MRVGPGTRLYLHLSDCHALFRRKYRSNAILANFSAPQRSVLNLKAIHIDRGSKLERLLGVQVSRGPDSNGSISALHEELDEFDDDELDLQFEDEIPPVQMENKESSLPSLHDLEPLLRASPSLSEDVNSMFVVSSSLYVHGKIFLQNGQEHLSMVALPGWNWDGDHENNSELMMDELADHYMDLCTVIDSNSGEAYDDSSSARESWRNARCLDVALMWSSHEWYVERGLASVSTGSVYYMSHKRRSSSIRSGLSVNLEDSAISISPSLRLTSNASGTSLKSIARKDWEPRQGFPRWKTLGFRN